jgi:hypothetical protein
MVRAIVVVLLVAAVAFAQPLEGPFTISQSSIHAGILDRPYITLRSADTADVFYQQGQFEAIVHVSVLLHSGQVLTGPDTIVASQAGYAHSLCDAIWNIDRWYVLDYADNGSGNITTLIEGSDEVAHRDTLQWQGDCPGSGSIWYCEEATSYLHLQARPAGGCYAYWSYDWWVHRLDGFEEGGFASRVVTSSSDGDTVTDCNAAALGYGQDSFLRVFPGDSLNLCWCDGVQAHMADLHSGNNCQELSAWDCVFAPTAELATADGRLFVLSHQSGSSPSRLLELSGNACAERFTQLSYPLAAASHPGYGIAWLSGGAPQLYLFRADTLGTYAFPPGLIAETISGSAIGAAAMAIQDNGLLAALWVEQTGTDSLFFALRVASVGWATLLGTDKPSTFVPSSFSLSCSPNPFNSTLDIRYDLPRAQQMELSIYNLLGQKVATLFDGRKTAGAYREMWTPHCGTGIYFVTMKTKETVHTTKVVYLK